MKKLPPMVMVEWRDACTYNEEYTGGKLCPMVASVGFLAHKSRREVHLVQNVWECGDERSAIAIPRGMVKRIVELKESQ